MTIPHLPVGRIRHGGDLSQASALYGEPAEGWLDLSTGVNPDAYPAPEVPSALLSRLPQSDAVDSLLAAARAAYGIAAQVPLVAAPGSDLLLRLLPVVAPTGPVAVVGPTYAGHGEAWRAAGRSVTDAGTLPEAEAMAPIVVLTNPNNPDGRRHQADALAGAADRLTGRGGALVVDEAFADFDPALSLAPHLGAAAAVVLRSFGKFFGLPGVRLGFAAGPPEIIGRLASLVGDWPVPAPALGIGTVALTDHAWQEAARATIAARAGTVAGLLRRHGLTLAGDGGLFLLVRNRRAAALHAGLAREGIWTRPFADRPDWLRLGLPPLSGVGRLDRGLASVLAGLG